MENPVHIQSQKPKLSTYLQGTGCFTALGQIKTLIVICNQVKKD